MYEHKLLEYSIPEHQTNENGSYLPSRSKCESVTRHICLHVTWFARLFFSFKLTQHLDIHQRDWFWFKLSLIGGVGAVIIRVIRASPELSDWMGAMDIGVSRNQNQAHGNEDSFDTTEHT